MLASSVMADIREKILTTKSLGTRWVYSNMMKDVQANTNAAAVTPTATKFFGKVKITHIKSHRYTHTHTPKTSKWKWKERQDLCGVLSYKDLTGVMYLMGTLACFSHCYTHFLAAIWKEISVRFLLSICDPILLDRSIDKMSESNRLFLRCQEWSNEKTASGRMLVRCCVLSLSKHGMVKKWIERIWSNKKLLFVTNSWLWIFSVLSKMDFLLGTSISGTAGTCTPGEGITIYQIRPSMGTNRLI